jgi:hypothetical protein
MRNLVCRRADCYEVSYFNRALFRRFGRSLGAESRRLPEFLEVYHIKAAIEPAMKLGLAIQDFFRGALRHALFLTISWL